MMIDAAIVVLENSFRHMEEHGKDRVTASIDGAEEVGAPVIASVLRNLAVFVPLLFLSGVSNLMFRQLSIVVSFSLTMSLFVALTIVPVLCSRLLKMPKPLDQRTGWTGRAYTVTERALAGADEGYRRLLHRALVHRPGVIGLAAATIVAAVFIFPTIPTEFVTQTDEGEVNVNVQLPNGTRIEPTDTVVARLEEEVRQLVPEATAIIASAGSGGGFRGGGTHRGQIQILLTPKGERERSSDDVAQHLRRRLSSIPGVQIRANASAGNNMVNRFLSGGGGDGGERISIEIRGESFDDAGRLALAAKDLMNATPGVADARVGQDEGRPELAIRVDRPKAALFGLTVTGVANTIRTNISGTQAAMFREEGNEYPIIVRLREEDREQVTDVENILLSTASGQVLPAKALMSIAPEIGPVSISRKNQRRITRVYGEPEGAISEAVAALEGPLQQLTQEAPPNFAVGFGDGVLEQDRAFDQLRLVLLLAIVLVYAVMASQFESLRDPFIIMFSIPTVALGVVLSLKLTGTAFNMQAYIGLIMLAGIVVNNAILLIDYTNVLRRRDGMGVREAVEVAGRRRLRPILMTSLSTVLGLVPMALGIGEGSELQVPLARVVIGGLLASLLITLVLVPTVYTLFEGGLKHMEPTSDDSIGPGRQATAEAT